MAQGVFDVGALQLRVLGSTYAARYSSAGVLPLADIESGEVDRYATLEPGQGGFSARHQLLAEVRVPDDDGEESGD